MTTATLTNPSSRAHVPSDICQAVIDQITARDAHGLNKYGVSLDRTDLSVQQWLQHMAEELMDGAHYALAAKRDLQQDIIGLVEEAYISTFKERDSKVSDFEAGCKAMRSAILSRLAP